MQGSTQLDSSSTGLDSNLAALLCYLLGFITGVAFLVLEKRSSFVRFHAMQSTIVFVGLFVARMVSLWIPPLAVLVTPIGLILWILLMVKAFQGERYKLPWVGDLAEERLGSGTS